MSIIGDLAEPQSRAVVSGLPLTGDTYDHEDEKTQGVMFMNFPVVLEGKLKEIYSDANKNSQSGKNLGTMLISVEQYPRYTRATLRAAEGKGDRDKWKKIKDIVGSSSEDQITPTTGLGIITPNLIGDIEYILEEEHSGVMFASFAQIEDKYLKDARSEINTHSLSGKRAGALIIAHDANRENIEIMVAAGADRKEPWKRLVKLKGSGIADITPTASDAGTIGKTPLTGDINQRMINKQGVYASCIPCYEDSLFKVDISNENDTKKSGKRLGSMVVLHNHEKNNYALFMAAGKKPTDKWIKVLDLKNTSNDITPQSSRPLP